MVDLSIESSLLAWFVSVYSSYVVSICDYSVAGDIFGVTIETRHQYILVPQAGVIGVP